MSSRSIISDLGQSISLGNTVSFDDLAGRAKKIIYPAVFGALFLYGWHSYGSTAPNYVLASPVEILDIIVARRVLLFDFLVFTGTEIVASLVIGVVLGLLLSFGIYTSDYVKYMLWPFIVVLQITPKSALLPLLIIYLGAGMTHKIVTASLAIIFVVIINTIEGFEETDQKYGMLAASMDLSEWAYFKKFIVPSAVSSIFSALYVSLSIAVTVVVVGEWIASDKGIGYLMTLGLMQGDSALIFAALATIIAFSLVVYYALFTIEKLAFPWLRAGDS